MTGEWGRWWRVYPGGDIFLMRMCQSLIFNSRWQQVAMNTSKRFKLLCRRPYLLHLSLSHAANQESNKSVAEAQHSVGLWWRKGILQSQNNVSVTVCVFYVYSVIGVVYDLVDHIQQTSKSLKIICRHIIREEPCQSLQLVITKSSVILVAGLCFLPWGDHFWSIMGFINSI